MILLLGASGYIGRTFASELRRRGHSFIPLTRRAFDYTRFDFLFDYLRTMRPKFLVNAASYSGNGSGRNSEAEREKMMAANAILPQMIARVCMMTNTPWGHLSSGSIYTGAKVMRQGALVVEKDLGRPEVIDLFEAHPEQFHGFTESDEPNFSFRSGLCSFWSGTRALAEEAIHNIGQSYIWRVRQPFNEREEPCNWLSRMRREDEVQDCVSSFSHLEDCVKACLDLWETQAPFGIYNVTNPGAMTMRHVAEEMRRIFKTGPHLFSAEKEESTREPQSHCILDAAKLLKTGVKMRPLAEAFADCLDRLRLTSRRAKPVLLLPTSQSAAFV
jgi:dTDP-4-dehydrorhamnose reductase